jgi:maleate isomerase
MPDTLGWRAKFAIITPAGNTVVQPEYDAMRPAGVTNHIFRIGMPNMASWDADSDMTFLVNELDKNIEAAVDEAVLCEPDHLVLGISIESVWRGGADAATALKSRIEDRAGGKLRVTQATDALVAALSAYEVTGPVAVIDPYFPVGEADVRGFLESIGHPVDRFWHLETPRPTGIAEVPVTTMAAALRELAAGDVAAVVQFGANLPMMRLAADAERVLGKPVIAINTATYWHALRTNGIHDKVSGCGRLLEAF